AQHPADRRPAAFPFGSSRTRTRCPLPDPQNGCRNSGHKRSCTAVQGKSSAAADYHGRVTFRSILCPVDFSPQSRLALRWAVAFGRRFGGRITVMFVNDPILIAAARAAYKGRRTFVDKTSAELARFVTQATRAGEELRERITPVVRVGNPADEILREVKRL